MQLAAHFLTYIEFIIFYYIQVIFLFGNGSHGQCRYCSCTHYLYSFQIFSRGCPPPPPSTNPQTDKQKSTAHYPLDGAPPLLSQSSRRNRGGWGLVPFLKKQTIISTLRTGTGLFVGLAQTTFNLLPTLIIAISLVQQIFLGKGNNV